MESRTIAKLSRRILPILLLLYILNYLDRVNVSFAGFQMSKDLGFSPSVYGFGVGVFFFGFALFELPSNLLLVRLGARQWISRIAITWGLLSAAMAFVDNATTFHWLRFFLGLAEAGFYPGIIYYISTWYPERHRARIIGIFMLAVPFSSVFGSILSGSLLALDGVGNLAGWKWLFLMEGLPSVVMGVIAYFYLPNFDTTESFLSREERSWLDNTMDRERISRQSLKKFTVLQALLDWRTIALTVMYFNITIGAYVIVFWLPQIIKTLGFTNQQVGLINSIPHICAGIAIFFYTQHSDYSGERIFHLAFACLVGAVGLAISTQMHGSIWSLIGISLAAAGIFASIPIFWAMGSSVTHGPAAAASIAIVTSLANLSGFVGPYLIGLLKEWTGSFEPGLFLISMFPLLGSVIAIVLRYDRLLGRRVSTLEEPAA